MVEVLSRGWNRSAGHASKPQSCVLVFDVALGHLDAFYELLGLSW